MKPDQLEFSGISVWWLTQSFLKDRLFLKNFFFPEFFLPWSLGTFCSVLTSMAAIGARFLVAGVWSTSKCCRLDSCSFKIWVWWNLEISVDSFFNCVRRFWYQISTCNINVKYVPRCHLISDNKPNKFKLIVHTCLFERPRFDETSNFSERDKKLFSWKSVSNSVLWWSVKRFLKPPFWFFPMGISLSFEIFFTSVVYFWWHFLNPTMLLTSTLLKQDPTSFSAKAWTVAKVLFNVFPLWSWPLRTFSFSAHKVWS